jgi:phospholipid/cholesterol/gamma-HCH transport system substrate-binding protein
METRAQYTLIGVFAIAVLAGALGFVWWFNASRDAAQAVAYRIVFTGSVSGLARGSVVRFNGLRVGEVTDLGLVENEPSRVFARIEIDPRTPVKTDTRARLEYAGLTGVAAVQLTGGSNAAPALTTPDGQGQPTIFAERSDFQDVLESAQRIAARTDAVLTRAEQLIATNETSVRETLENTRIFTQALSDNSQGVSAFLASVGQAGERIASLSVQLERLVVDADGLLRAVDPASLNRIVGNVETLTQTLADNRPQIQSILAETAAAAQQINRTAATLDATLTDLAGVIDGVEAARIGSIVRNVDEIAATVAGNAAAIDTAMKDIAALGASARELTSGAQSTLASIDTFAKALAERSGDVGRIVEGTGALIGQLGGTARTLDAALVDVNRLTAGIDSARLENTLASIERFSAALGDNAGSIETTIRDVAGAAGRIEALTARVEGVIGNVDAFTKTLADSRTEISAFVTDAGTLVRDLSASTASLDEALGEAARIGKALDADAINRVLADAQRFTAALGDNAGEVESTLKRINEIATTLNAAAGRVDEVVAAAQTALGPGEGGVVANVNRALEDFAVTAREFQTTASAISGATGDVQRLMRNLDRRTEEITSGVNRLTGPGLRDLRALTQQTRRAIDEVNRAAASLRRNPSQVIFGGEAGLPAYDGSR